MKVPSLKLHPSPKNRVYFTRWGGRMHYFTRDKAESEHLFAAPSSTHPGSLAAWQRWRDAQAPDLPLGPAEALTVGDLARRFIGAYENARRRETATYYRQHLRRFVNTFGLMPISAIDETALEAFRMDFPSLGLAPKTETHDLKAIKTMWRWGSSPARQLCHALALDAIKTPRLKRSRPEPIDLPEIKARLRAMPDALAWLHDYLAFVYLTGCRPSECIRVAYGQGRIIDLPPDHSGPAIKNAAVLLTEHKTAARVEGDRIIVLSPEALDVCRRLVPMPMQRRRKLTVRTAEDGLDVKHRSNQFSAAAKTAGVPGWPHRLRDSAATHLLAMGVGPADVDLILGHEPTGELRRYGLASPRLLRERVARITLR